MRLGDGATVAALVVTNAVGNVVRRDGRILAGIRDGADGYRDANDVLLHRGGERVLDRFGTNTTLAVIGTDAALDRAGCRKLAEIGHDAFALAIRPVHTMFDGDTVFAVSTGRGASAPAMDLSRLGAAAVEVLVDAIERSVSPAIVGNSVSRSAGR